MWKNLLPEEVRRVHRVYDKVAHLEVLPYLFILTMESVKYIEGLVEREDKDELTLSKLESYLLAKGVSEDLITEFDSLRIVRNNMAHNLYTVHLSIQNLELFEEYLAVLDSIVESVLKELGLLQISGIRNSDIFAL